MDVTLDQRRQDGFWVDELFPSLVGRVQVDTNTFKQREEVGAYIFYLSLTNSSVVKSSHLLELPSAKV